MVGCSKFLENPRPIKPKQKSVHIKTLGGILLIWNYDVQVQPFLKKTALYDGQRLEILFSFFLLQRINNFLVFTFFLQSWQTNAAAKKNKLSFELLLRSLAASAFEGYISCVM